MINFYGRFIKGAALLLKPLTDALRGSQKSKLEWNEEMEKAFQLSKQKLSACVQLAHPDPSAEIVLAVDASGMHIGAVLQQQEARGGLRPLGFFSVKLYAAQQKYSAFNHELLAVYLSIRHYRWALEGRRFHVLSDHKPLTYALHRTTNPWMPRHQRQLSYVAEFTSDIRHVAGKENVVADALSRPAAAVAPVEGVYMDLKNLARAQADCPETVELRGRLEVQELDVGGVLLSARGDTCHQENGQQQCARGKVTVQEKAPVEAIPGIPVPQQCFSHVHLDIVGPLTTSSQGQNYLLTMMDRTTSWPEVVPMTDISAQRCVDEFVSMWVARGGVPARVTTDRGTQFTGSAWQDLCRSIGMEHVSTTAYHPQSNGLIERFHHQLKESLRARCGEKDWLCHLPWVLWLPKRRLTSHRQKLCWACS